MFKVEITPPNKESKLSSDEKDVIKRLYRQGAGVPEIANHLGRSPEMIRKYVVKLHKEEGEQVGNGVLLIGIALILLINASWFWPGILFAVAASMVARGLIQHDARDKLRGAVWVAGIGFVFSLPGHLFLPAILTIVGIASIASYFLRNRKDEAYREKRKVEEILREREAAYEKPKRSQVRLTDDGELADVIEEEDLYSDQRLR